MKVLFVHNYYGSSSPSGENRVFELEADMLRRYCHEVELFTRHSDEIRDRGYIGVLQGAASVPWNPFSASRVRQTVHKFMPDVVHVHNTFPLISPSIFSAIDDGTARVLTLHNYRLFCPAAIPMRNSAPCTECLDLVSSWPSLKYGCYRESRLATLPLAFSVWLHRIIGTWRRHVDAFIVLSDFQKELMVRSGLPRGTVHVKPNFYPGSPPVVPWNERRDAVVFAGRLSREKGVETLVQAWLMWGDDAPELRILGDGPVRANLEEMVSSGGLSSKIRFLGQVSSADAENETGKAKLLILPSEWFEGFPMVVREGFALGTPSAVSGIGPLPSIVQAGENGLVFKARNPESLLSTVRGAWKEPGLLEYLSRGARKAFEEKYTEEANYRRLLEIYEAARGERKKRAGV